MMRPEYVFDTASELGRHQMDQLELLLDDSTTDCLERAGVRPGHRCLDVGAGGGSITRWLAERTGPDGSVVALDIDVDQLADGPGVTVHRHDINGGVPPGGPFDLIHARLVLMHLSRREEVLSILVDALAPGGWIVTADLSDRPPRVLSAPTNDDADLFARVLDLAMKDLAPKAGMSLQWAGEACGRLVAAGMADVDRRTVRLTSTGGGAGCRLYGNYVRQLEPLLLDLGLTDAELTRFYELTTDSRLRTEFFELAYTVGRKAAVHERSNA